MSRVIDGDALNTRIDKCVGIDCLGLEPVMAIRDVKALISVMPTINAIPVEWLDNKFLDIQNKDKALSRAAWLVLHAWQKEQEARQ